MEHGESPWQAVIREVKEETGLDVEISGFVGIYSKTDVDELAFAFLCRPVGGTVTLNDEADDIRYYDLSALPQNISAKQVERIEDALAHREKTVCKIQIGKS